MSVSVCMSVRVHECGWLCVHVCACACVLCVCVCVIHGLNITLHLQHCLHHHFYPWLEEIYTEKTS